MSSDSVTYYIYLQCHEMKISGEAVQAGTCESQLCTADKFTYLYQNVRSTWYEDLW